MCLKLPDFKVKQRTEAGVVPCSVQRGRVDDDMHCFCRGYHSYYDKSSRVEEEDASDPRSDSSFVTTFELLDNVTGPTRGEPAFHQAEG